jgi:hypothetical protein
MPSSQATAVTNFRRRLKRRGMVRVEVKVRKEDAELVRRVAQALTDPERESEARALLRGRFADIGAGGLKALLAAAPLEDIDLERTTDTGRDVKL